MPGGASGQISSGRSARSSVSRRRHRRGGLRTGAGARPGRPRRARTGRARKARATRLILINVTFDPIRSTTKFAISYGGGSFNKSHRGLLYSLPGRTSDVDARSGSGSRLGWTTDTSSHYPCRGRWESWTDRRHRRNCKWRFPRDDHEGNGGFLENPRAHQVRGWAPPTEDHKALEFDRW